MLTLSEAFRLCGIEDETVYLMLPGTKTYGLFSGKYIVSARIIRNKLDMKKIIVHRISVQLNYEGEYVGMFFVVTGASLSEEKLMRLQYV